MVGGRLRLGSYGRCAFKENTNTMISVVVAMITGAALVTGLLFAFSNFVMAALADVSTENAVEVMQRINVRIINPVFFFLFVGTPVLCLIVVIQTFLNAGENLNLWLPVGATLYLIGPLGITLMFNVPLNDRLAKIEKSNANEWEVYQAKWQGWNHLRTYIGIVSIVLMAVGLSTMKV